MNAHDVVDFSREAVATVILIASPILITALVVGLLTGVIQAMTQVQDHSVSSIPKLLAVGVVLIICGPWMAEHLVEYAQTLIRQIPEVVLSHR